MLLTGEKQNTKEISTGVPVTNGHPPGPGPRDFFPINAPGMGRFQLLNLGFFGYVLVIRFWVVIAIIVSLSLTITLITALRII